MGSPPGTESQYGDGFVKQHRVELNRGFWMQKTEVTQAQYVSIMGRNPSHWQGSGKQTHPVDRVTWDDANEVWKRLSILDPKHDYLLLPALPPRSIFQLGEKIYCVPHEWRRDLNSETSDPTVCSINCPSSHPKKRGLFELTELAFMDCVTR